MYTVLRRMQTTSPYSQWAHGTKSSSPAAHLNSWPVLSLRHITLPHHTIYTHRPIHRSTVTTQLPFHVFVARLKIAELIRFPGNRVPTALLAETFPSTCFVPCRLESLLTRKMCRHHYPGEYGCGFRDRIILAIDSNKSKRR